MSNLNIKILYSRFLIVTVLIACCFLRAQDPSLGIPAGESSFERLYNYVFKTVNGTLSLDPTISLTFKNVLQVEFEKENQRPVLDTKTVEELELIANKDSDDRGILGQLPTQTVVGKLRGALELSFPLHQREQLKQLEIGFKAFINNPELLKTVQEKLRRLKELEPELLKFYDSHETARLESINPFSSSAKTSVLWQNVQCFDLKNQFSSNIVHWIPSAIINVFLWYAAVKSNRPLPSRASICKILFLDTLFGIPTLSIKDLSYLYRYSYSRYYSRYLYSGKIEKALASMPKISQDLIVASTWYRRVQDVRKIVKHNGVLSDFLHNRLKAISEYIRITEELKTIIKQHPSIANQLKIPNIETTSKDTQRFMEMIKSDTFDKNTNFVLNKGKLLVAYYLMQQEKHNLLPLLQAVGKLDFRVACAQLFLERNGQQGGQFFPTNYETLPEGIATNKAGITVIDGWNIHLNPKTVVTSNVGFGQDGKQRIAIFTGLNENGKTQTAKIVILNAILAQSLGFAAGIYKGPIVHTARVFANDHDSTTDNASKYRAELRRSKGMLDTMAALKPGENGIVVIDEPLTSTNQVAGSIALCGNKEEDGFVDQLAALKNVFATIVSFHEELAKKAERSPENFKNYHMVAEKQPDGTFKRSYKIAEGYSTDNDALYLAREAGILRKKSEVTEPKVAAAA